MRFLCVALTFLPRHVRDEVLTRSCGCLVTFESRPWQQRVEVFLYKRLQKYTITCVFKVF